MELGPRTMQLLKEFGVADGDLADVIAGRVSWELMSGDTPDGESDLILLHEDGGHKHVATLSTQQVDDVLNAWDFERRAPQALPHSDTFPPGTYEDWAGVCPDSNWEDLVSAYLTASSALRQSASRHVTEPWLFLCRHTIELQLKTIVMLGQEALDLHADLPDHHDLRRLWTAAHPFERLHEAHDQEASDGVKRLVVEYHRADPKSISFRYPVSRSNKPLEHPPFVERFSVDQHAATFERACSYLGQVIRSLRLRILSGRIQAHLRRGKATDPPSPNAT